MAYVLHLASSQPHDHLVKTLIAKYDKSPLLFLSLVPDSANPTK